MDDTSMTEITIEVDTPQQVSAVQAALPYDTIVTQRKQWFHIIYETHGREDETYAEAAAIMEDHGLDTDNIYTRSI